MESRKIQVSLTIADAQLKLPEIVQEIIADNQEVTLLENGEKVAAIISINTLKDLNQNIEEDLIDSAEIYAEVFEEDKELQELTELALQE